MRIVSKKLIHDCARDHADARSAFVDWIQGVERAEWVSSADVRAGRWNPSILPGRRVVFRIRGNRYRIVVRVDYANQMVFVRFAGTHGEYDGVDAATI